MAVDYAITVLMRLLGVWTDVSRDVMRPLDWTRGINGNSPKDNIAGPGTCQLVMRNDETNSAELLGYYSPNHPNCRAGFGEGTLVQICGSSGSIVNEPLWTGTVQTILPDPGIYGTRRAHLVAQDCMGVLADADVTEVGRQIEQDEVAVLNAVLDSLPADSQPLDRDFDAPVTEFPVALDDIGQAERAYGVAEKIVTSARGYLFPTGRGALRYQSIGTRYLEVSQFTFPDTKLAAIEVPSSSANVFKRVTIVIHPKTFQPAGGSPLIMVLASHDGTLAIEPGATVELFLSYQDPDRPEVQIGGTDFEEPLEAGVDYLFNAAADGLGADVTADMVVVGDFFAASIKFTITNNGLVTAHKQILQGRGRGIYDQKPVQHRAGAGGGNEITIDLPYQGDGMFAQGNADFLEASYRDLADQVNALVYFPQDSDELMAQAFTREIGQVVDASESVTLPNGVSAYIQSIGMSVDENDLLLCRYGLAPRITTDVRPEDNVVCHDRLYQLIEAAHEAVVDVDRVDFAEVGA